MTAFPPFNRIIFLQSFLYFKYFSYFKKRKPQTCPINDTGEGSCDLLYQRQTTLVKNGP